MAKQSFGDLRWVADRIEERMLEAINRLYGDNRTTVKVAVLIVSDRLMLQYILQRRANRRYLTQYHC